MANVITSKHQTLRAGKVMWRAGLRKPLAKAAWLAMHKGKQAVQLRLVRRMRTK